MTVKPPTNAPVANPAALSRRASVISDSSIHCCPAYHWEPYTRNALRAWLARSDRPPVIALSWDPDTGQLSRVTERDDPSLRTVMGLLVETDRRIPGHVEGSMPRFADADEPGASDVLDDLAERVLKTGGQVVAVPKGSMPTATGLAAVFRY